MDFDTVVANLRAVLLSTKGGVPICKVMRDYKLIVGEPIDYRSLGFRSLESFIKSVPGFRLINVNGEMLLDAIPTEQTEHVAALIAKQRQGCKKSKAHPPTAFKPRVPHYKGFSKKPPSKFQRPAIAPRFAAASKKPIAKFLSRDYDDDDDDDDVNYGSESEELEYFAVEEEASEIVKYENTGHEENSLSDQVSHLSLQEQNENKLQKDSTNFNESSNPSESEENSIFMSRLAQLTSQIHSSPPSRSFYVPASTNGSKDDIPDVLSLRLAHFMPHTGNFNSVSNPEFGFQEDSPHNVMKTRLPRLSGPMHKEERNSDSFSNEDFNVSNSKPDDNEEGNIFNRRLAHFSSKLYNKALENDVLGSNSTFNAHNGHFPFFNSQCLMKPFSNPDFLSSAPVPPQSYRQQFFSNDAHGKIVPPDSKDSFIYQNIFKSEAASTGILNLKISPSGAQIPGSNELLSNLQTPSPPSSYASESDKNSIHTYSRNPHSSSEMAVSFVSSESVSPKSDVSGAMSLPASYLLRNFGSSLKAAELPDQKLMSSHQKKRSVISDFGFEDLRATPESAHLIKNSLSLPDFILPAEDIWDIFILCAFSTQEIWANIIGRDYSDAFEAMAQKMELYYADKAVKTASYKIGCLYALQMNGLWHRVRLEDIEGEDCYVFLLDIGLAQQCPLSSLFILDQRFTDVPAQAICLSLFGLEDYVNDFTINELLVEYVHKPFVAEVVHRNPYTSGISVYLCDVSTGVDVVINDVLKKLVA